MIFGKCFNFIFIYFSLILYLSYCESLRKLEVYRTTLDQRTDTESTSHLRLSYPFLSTFILVEIHKWRYSLIWLLKYQHWFDFPSFCYTLSIFLLSQHITFHEYMSLFPFLFESLDKCLSFLRSKLLDNSIHFWWIIILFSLLLIMISLHCFPLLSFFSPFLFSDSLSSI